MKYNNSTKQVATVFLSGSRGSGVEFIHSILDSHPQVLAIPFPVMFHYFWRNHLREITSDLDKLFDNICKNSGLSMVLNNYRVLDNSYMINDRRTTRLLPIDNDLFRETFKKVLAGKVISRKSVFIALYRSYAVAIGRKWEDISVILENSHNTFYHNEILEDFPDARFISPIRDPHAIFASCRKGRFGDVYEGLSESAILMHLYQTFINQEIYYKLLGKNRYLLIKNEDIHANKEKAIRQLADWLGINFHDSLMTTSFAGSPWDGNSAYRKKISTDVSDADEKVTKRWMNELRRGEILLVEYLFGQYIRANGYEFYSSLARCRNPLRSIGFLSFFIPVKNQFNIRGVGISLSRSKIVKYLEYFLYPLSRAILFLFYRYVYHKYSHVNEYYMMDPDQNIFPKFRTIT